MPSLVQIRPVVWEENGDKQTDRQTDRHTFLFYIYRFCNQKVNFNAIFRFLRMSKVFSLNCHQILLFSPFFGGESINFPRVWVGLGVEVVLAGRLLVFFVCGGGII